MAREHHLAAVSAAADLVGFASNVTGAAFTLTANNSGDSLAHKVTIRNDSATDHSGKTVLLVGTAPNGEPQTESVTGPGNGATVTSTKYFRTLTSATPSATIGADTFDIGWAADSLSAWYPFAADRETFNVGIGCEVVSGSPNYTVQISFGGGAFNHANLTSKTASAYSDLQAPCKAIRLLFAAAGGVTLTAIQAGG